MLKVFIFLKKLHFYFYSIKSRPAGLMNSASWLKCVFQKIQNAQGRKNLGFYKKIAGKNIPTFLLEFFWDLIYSSHINNLKLP